MTYLCMNVIHIRCGPQEVCSTRGVVGRCNVSRQGILGIEANHSVLLRVHSVYLESSGPIYSR